MSQRAVFSNNNFVGGKVFLIIPPKEVERTREELGIVKPRQVYGLKDAKALTIGHGGFLLES